MPVSSKFRLQFHETVDRIYQTVCENLHEVGALTAALDNFDQPTFLKNEERILVAANRAFARSFSGEQPTGRRGQSFLAPSFQRVADQTDEIILSGTVSVECVHAATAYDGHDYLWIFAKRSLTSLRRHGYAILGVVQAIERLQTDSGRLDFGRLAETFRSFDDRDRELCRRIVLGQSSAEIGAAIEMTARNVELRRKKAFDAMSVSSPVELTRLLVQMQERGYLDLGL